MRLWIANPRLNKAFGDRTRGAACENRDYLCKASKQPIFFDWDEYRMASAARMGTIGNPVAHKVDSITVS
ncbi:hypothetical protein P7L53_14880 [Thermoleptolyngbya sichuanensis XZ-Cy5]|uniref:hypothetical protein n=1 Tax=Thermoleptolyngbya sichuanensis TaxID=2885951 RepID=UPI00240DFB2B|nr:hypothetical protein [Thermoleptolyngbya sichuanensis]MDG2617523.1 hypothetical protein [Thermoleptolyngbya sichuanensis XZ-Cy5]